MAKHRIKKYSRRTTSAAQRSKAGLAVFLVIAFVILSVIISVAVGIALGRRADKLPIDKNYDLDMPDYESNGKKVSGVEAYHFPTGANPADYVYQDIYDLSVAVRHKDGSLSYHLNAGEKFPIDEMGERSFETLCDNASDAGARVCAYFYVTSFDVEDEHEREIIKAYEIALIAEIAESGADDILLLGLSVTENNVSEIEKFVSDAAKAAENAPVGVAIDRETVLLTEKEIYLAGRMRAACDYLALDLTDLKVSDGESLGKDPDGNPLESRLSEILGDFRYYIKTYSMRLIFAQAEYKLYEPALKLGAENIQIVGE